MLYVRHPCTEQRPESLAVLSVFHSWTNAGDIPPVLSLESHVEMRLLKSQGSIMRIRNTLSYIITYEKRAHDNRARQYQPAMERFVTRRTVVHTPYIHEL